MTEDAKKTATSEKLTWMNALAADPRIKPRAFEIGFCIAQHVNAKTGVAILSDETIGEKTVSSRSDVIRARKVLLETHWIDWRRTKLGNIYRPLPTNLNSMLDYMQVKREARLERQKERRLSALKDVPPATHLGASDVPPATLEDVSPAVSRCTARDTHTPFLHPQDYTLKKQRRARW